MSQPADRGSRSDWTVARVLSWAADDFRARGIESPRLDAELLLGHVLGVDRVRLILEAPRILSAGELTAYRELIQRRRRREPIAYIRGEREFYGLPIKVDRRVLVPRPDTETLVEVALERTARVHLDGDLLDLCTGSGCVAVAFSRRRPTWRVVGIDISEDAVDVARENAERAGAVLGVSFVVGDLDVPLPSGAWFDLVTANPPYIPSGEIETLDADVRDFEPRIALDGGKDGLDVVRRVVAVAAKRLRPGGIAALEVGAGQAPAVVALLEGQGFANIQAAVDYGGHERVVSGEMTSVSTHSTRQ
jgi:release factor glutamine methyltransferase